MEKTNEMRNAPGSRQVNFGKSFKLSGYVLCQPRVPKRAFPNFINAEQERLHRLFIQVITTLHENIEDEFKSLCLETQAGTILESVEQHIEEQSLEPLLNEKSNIGAIGQTLSGAKRNETHYLMGMLENDYARDQDDRRSTSGYAFVFGTCAILWSSKKQSIVILSSTEVELVVAIACACQTIWLRRILEELLKFFVTTTQQSNFSS